MQKIETTISNKAYQDWTNCQTWAVALTIDNDRLLLEQVLNIFRFIHPTLADASEGALIIFCKMESKYIVNVAPWAFENPWTQGIDWTQLRHHYQRKISEGC